MFVLDFFNNSKISDNQLHKIIHEGNKVKYSESTKINKNINVCHNIQA